MNLTGGCVGLLPRRNGGGVRMGPSDDEPADPDALKDPARPLSSTAREEAARDELGG